MRSLLVLASFASLAAVCACSSSDHGTLQLVTGGETDTFSKSPAPTKLTVNAIDGSGNKTTIASATLPTSDIDLGTQDENAVATLQVLGTDSSGADVVAGSSLALQYGALAGGTLPVFVQRTNEWARLPSPLSDTRPDPTLAVISGEFLFVGGGSRASAALDTQLYDFASLSALSTPPQLPRVPWSMPVVGTVGLVIDPSGATYYDFSQNAEASVTAPSGFAFGDVAGGQVLYDYDASSQSLTAVFVVGATRTSGAPTSAILEIDATDTSDSSYPSGKLHWISLTQPRLGAAAVWVSGRGIVVAGGSSTAAGLEVVQPATSSAQGSAAALAFPPDGTMGAGAATTDSQHVLIAGGLGPTGQDAGVRLVDLACAQNCATAGVQVWGAGLPVPLTTASVFVLSSGGTYPAMVVGNELATDLTHVFLLNSAKTSTEAATKVPHVGARAIQSPLPGSVLLFGGAGEIESFFPPQQ